MQAQRPIVLNPEGQLPGLIVVDHAGTSVPDALAGLGLAPQWRETHHFTDLGVAELAQGLAARLDVPVVMCSVSRLVLDVNRWISDPRSVTACIDGTDIPANQNLSATDYSARQEAVFWPYHELVGRVWAQQMARHARPFFFALHTCTRVFEGFRRPWDGGTIWHDDESLSRLMLRGLGEEAGLTLGDNKPYSGRDGIYTVDRHTFGSGLPACGFEVANDMLETKAGRDAWADRLARALAAAVIMETAA